MGIRYEQAVLRRSPLLRDMLEMSVIAVAQQVMREDDKHGEDREGYELAVLFARQVSIHGSTMRERVLDVLGMEVVWAEPVLASRLVRDGEVHLESLTDEFLDGFVLGMWGALARGFSTPVKGSPG